MIGGRKEQEAGVLPPWTPRGGHHGLAVALH